MFQFIGYNVILKRLKAIKFMLLDKNVTGADIAAIINNAMENSFIRQGIYEKMDNGTFSSNDINDVVITFNDILSAIIDYKKS